MSAPGQETPAEGAQTTAPETAAPSVDMSALQDRMGELAQNVGSFTSRFDALEQRLPQPEPQAEPDPWADLFPQDPSEQQFDPYQQQANPPPQMDPQAIQAAVNHAIQQQNAPLVQRLQQFELQQAEQRLYEQIPQLKPVPQGHADYETNQAARTQMASLVQQATASFPPQIAQALLADPNFFALTWKAAEADRLAQGQAPAGGNAPSLEAAGGAMPGGTSTPVNPVDQAYGGRQGLPTAWG